MDTIFIENLRVKARIGTTEKERKIPQYLIVSIRLQVKKKPKKRAENLCLYVDYGYVAHEVQRLIETSRFHLVETLAEAIADKILLDKKIFTVWLRIAKQSILNAEHVGIEIIRKAKK